jgi:translation initiation factor 2 beta subunit (eIF-2beta)/eIF-5
MYATAVGLLMKALERPSEELIEEEAPSDTETMTVSEEGTQELPKTALTTGRKTIIERFGDRLKEFLDNA